MATGVVGAQLPHRAALPQLPRREIRKAGKLKQSQLVAQLTAQLTESQYKLRLSVQRQAAITASCDAACGVCLRFGAGSDFTKTLVSALSSALHNLAASDAYVLMPISACQEDANVSHGAPTADADTSGEVLVTSDDGPTSDDSGCVSDERCASEAARLDVPFFDASKQCVPVDVGSAACDHAQHFSIHDEETTACADAAAGAGYVNTSLAHEPTRQALDDVHAKHRVGGGRDSVISPIHTTAPHPIESAPEMRRTALSSRDEGAHPVESVPGKLALSSRVEFVHSSPVLENDLNSSDLARQCGPLPNCASPLLFGANAQTCSASSEDCKSQDFVEQYLPTLATRSANQEDFNSQDLAEQCGPLPNSPPNVLFDASAHTCSAISEDFNSHDLAVQCGPLPNSASAVLCGANAHTCSAINEDYNSQDLAEQCLPTLADSHDSSGHDAVSFVNLDKTSELTLHQSLVPTASERSLPMPRPELQPKLSLVLLRST